MDKAETKFVKVLDKRKKLFGINIEGHKDWYVAPVFEQLGKSEWPAEENETWFKHNGKYSRRRTAHHNGR